jgi:predicted N-formylglutamate amidohydrolase
MSLTCLGPGDPPPVLFCGRDGPAQILLTCDHASNRVPSALADLGLTREALSRHIGWDIGAGEVSRGLARRLDAAAVLAGHSRLVIDCNRDPGDATSIAATSDGIAIPGNRDLSPQARQVRQTEIFAPYHAAIADWIETRLARAIVPALLSIHSFTPAMGGKARPWHVGILWDADPRIPVPLLEGLRADPALVVGDNEPYSARMPAGYTVRHHAVARGLPHVAIELRQDLIEDAAGAERWADRLAAALAPILARRELYHARV